MTRSKIRHGAVPAGRSRSRGCQRVSISKISDWAKGQFTDTQDQVISNLFKLYPWEYMLREVFSTKLEDAGVRWLEPAWKSIISNKALLPMLWEMFPDHPNLLPAYFAEDDYPANG